MFLTAQLCTSPTSDGVESLDSNKTVELHTYSLMGDNLDTTIKRRYMRTDSCLERSLHYFHVLAVKDRIK